MGGLEIASMFAKISVDSSDFSKGMKSVKDDMSFAEKGVVGLQNTISAGFKAAVGVAVVALAGLATGISYATNKAADMEQGIADIGAVMTLTDAETERLQDHIMELGLSPELKVSATEAAGAVMALGTAGLSMSEIMGGASKATILLANATGLKGEGGFAAAANIATDIMAQFNINASDMDAAIDQVAGTTIASKLTIDDYRLAIGQAGGVAGMLGVTFEDFNAVIAATAPTFSSGSDAGTSFKTFLTTLIPVSEKAADMMASLGLLTDESGNQFYNAAGEMKSMGEISGVLQTAFAGLTEAQRNDAAATIFGRDAMRTALALAEGGIPIITEMKGEIGKVDAEELAAKRMDTLKGSWEIFLGIVDTLTLGIGDKFLPVARKLIDWAGELALRYGPPLIEWAGNLAEMLEIAITSIVEAAGTGQILNEKFAALPKPIQETIRAAGVFITTMKGVIGQVVTSISRFVDWQDILDVVTKTLPPLWEKLVTVGRAIGDVIEMVKATFTPLAETIGKFFGWQDILTAVAAMLSGAMVAAIGAWLAAMWPTIAFIATLSADIAALRWAWETDFAGIRTSTQSVLRSISDWFYNESGIWKGTLEKTLEYIDWWANWGWRDSLYNPVIKWVTDTTRDMIIWWNRGIANLKGILATLADGAMYIFNSLTGEIVAWAIHWTDQVVDKVDYWGRRTKTLFTLYVNEFRAKFEEWRDNAIRIYNDMVDDVEDWYNDTFGWFKPKEWWQAGIDMVTGLWDGLKQAWATVKNWWTGEAPELGEELATTYKMKSPSQVFHAYGANMMQGLQMGISENVPSVGAALQQIGPVVSDVLTGVIGQITENGRTLFGYIQGVIDQSALWVKETLESGAVVWRNTIDNSIRPVLNDFYSQAAQAQRALSDLRNDFAQPITPPVIPPLPPPLANPNQPGTPGPQPVILPPVGPTGPQVGTFNFGTTKVPETLQYFVDDLETALANISDLGFTIADAIFEKTGTPIDTETQQQVGALKYYGSTQTDMLLIAVQQLIAKLNTLGLGNQFNLNMAPGENIDNRIELEAFVAYLQAMYA